MTEDTTGANSGRMLVQRHRPPWREATEGLRRHSSSIMGTKMTAMAGMEQEEEATGQSMETTNIKMAAMARVILAGEEEVDLRKMVGEAALIWLRANEGPTILREAVWGLQEIGAGRTCHEEVDHQAMPQAVVNRWITAPWALKAAQGLPMATINLAMDMSLQTRCHRWI